MVNAAYGDQALSRSNVFRCYGRFCDGREDTEDDPRSDRPTECRIDNNVEMISQSLLQNRHLSLRMLADEVNIGKDTVRKTVGEDVRKWKICSRFVPHSLTQRDNRQAVFGPTKSDCARPSSVFARFSTCWLLFVSKSEIPLEGAPLWLVFGHPENRDKYIKHHRKGRLLQRHPEAVWPCKCVCTVTRDLRQKLNNKSVISFTQTPFIMPVLKLSRRTVYVETLMLTTLQRVIKKSTRQYFTVL